MPLAFFDSIIKFDFCEELTRRTTVRVCSSIPSALCVFRSLACALQTRACTLAWLTTVAAPDRRRPPSPSPWTGRPGSPQPSWRRSQGSIYRLGTSPRCYTAWRTGTPSRRSHGESFLRTYCRVDTYGRTDPSVTCPIPGLVLPPPTRRHYTRVDMRRQSCSTKQQYELYLGHIYNVGRT